MYLRYELSFWHSTSQCYKNKIANCKLEKNVGLQFRFRGAFSAYAK